MLFQTHILLGVVLFLLSRPLLQEGNEIVFFLLVLLGSILPDIDSRNSKINRWSGAIGIIVVFFAKHRSLFHSLVFHISLFFVVQYFFDWYYATALLLGYLAHLIGDGITPAGVMVLYPFSSFKIRGPVKVGGFMEGVVMVLLAFLIVKEFFL